MKNTELPKLKDRTTFEKILFGFRIILSISVITTATLQLANILNWKNNVSQILIGFMFFVMFLEYRKHNTLLAYLNLGTSIFSISVFMICYYMNSI